MLEWHIICCGSGDDVTCIMRKGVALACITSCLVRAALRLLSFQKRWDGEGSVSYLTCLFYSLLAPVPRVL